MSFWVYENTIHKKARIHRGDCPYCAEGRGIHGGGKTASGNWHGPFSNIDTAENVAKNTRQLDIRGCDLCIADTSLADLEAKLSQRSEKQDVAPTEPLHRWDAELDHACSLQLSWKPTGIIVLDEAAKLRFPKADTIPGLYRFRTRTKQGRSSLYIGESDNLSRRFGNYRNPGPTQQTSLRINQFLTDLLTSGGEVSVSLAMKAAIDTAGGRIPVDFSDKNIRRLFECLAIALEHATDVTTLNR